MQFADFINQPYLDRQVAVFADDRLVAELERRGLLYRRPGFFDGLDVGWSISIGPDAERVLAAFWRAQFRDVNLCLVPKSWSRHFQLPLGHPRTATVYAGHPAVPTRYVPVSDFHRAVFEHKIAELLSILTSLGAVQIRVECVQGWGAEMASKIGLGLPSAHITLQTSAGARTSSRVLYEATLSVDRTPQLPSDLAWFPHEPLWKHVAQSRLNGGLTEFSLTVDYREDFGITVKVKTAADRAGFDIGGEFVRHESTIWRMNGSFQPRR